MIALFLSYNSYPLGIAYGQEKKEKVEGEELPYVGVLDLEAKEGVPTSAVAPLSDSLRKEFFNTKKFKVLDRKNMHVILKEQGFQQVGCTSSECAVEAGRLLGVEKMVTGNIAKLGDTYYISVTVTNVETGEVERMADEKCRGEIEQLFDAIGRIVGKITGVTPEVPAPAAAPGVLKVSGEPANAQISLDGSTLGPSPQEIEVTPGTHKIEVSKSGYKSYTRELQLAEGESHSISYSLEKMVGLAPEIETQVSEERIPKEERGFGISLVPRFVRGDGNILGVGMRFQPRIFKDLWFFFGGFYSVLGSVGDLKVWSADEEYVEIEVDKMPKKSYMISSGAVYALPFFEKSEISFEIGYDYCSTTFDFTEVDNKDLTDSISVKGSGHHEAINLSYYSSGSSVTTLTVGYIKLPSLPIESENGLKMSDEIGFSGLLLELRLGTYW